MIVTPKDAIRMAKGDMSYVAISKLLNKTDSYTGVVMNGRTIGSQPMVDILDALGYDTIVRNKRTHEEVKISPSRDEVMAPHTLQIQIYDQALYDRIVALIDSGELEERLKEKGI